MYNLWRGKEIHLASPRGYAEVLDECGTFATKTFFALLNKSNTPELTAVLLDQLALSEIEYTALTKYLCE